MFERQNGSDSEDAKLHVDDLPRSCVSRRDDLAFGDRKIYKPDEGCACPMSALEKGFLRGCMYPDGGF